MPITLKDIANRSGFSVTTVSRALGGYDDVSAGTRKRILAIAEELGYEPNTIARQLQGQRTYTLGLIMPERSHTNDDDFFSLLLKGITYEAANNGYDVLISAAKNSTSEMESYRHFVGGKRVDGMIIARTRRHDERIAYLQSSGCPFVVQGRRAPDETTDFSFIDVDSRLGIELLVEHLIGNGHQHIGIILPDPNLAFTPYRLTGYQDALENANIPLRTEYCVHSDLTYEGGQVAGRALLTQNPSLTAIVGCNDWMALGAMSVIKDMELVAGSDIAIVGYDDIPAASRSEPALTSVGHSIYDMGEQVTQALIEQIENDTAAEFQLLIRPELKIRESSGGLRNYS